MPNKSRCSPLGDAHDAASNILDALEALAIYKEDRTPYHGPRLDRRLDLLLRIGDLRNRLSEATSGFLMRDIGFEVAKQGKHVALLGRMSQSASAGVWACADTLITAVERNIAVMCNVDDWIEAIRFIENLQDYPDEIRAAIDEHVPSTTEIQRAKDALKAEFEAAVHGEPVGSSGDNGREEGSALGIIVNRVERLVIHGQRIASFGRKGMPWLVFRAIYDAPDHRIRIDDIIKEVWPETSAETNLVDKHVSKANEILRDAGVLIDTPESNWRAIAKG